MKVFYTPSTEHFAKKIDLPYGKLIIRTFADGEIFVKIDENVYNKDVWVVAATNPPAQHLLELFFLLDALQRAQATIHLLVTYFGYARQDKAEPGEALSAQVIANFFNTFDIHSLDIIHIHNPGLKQFLSFKNFIPYEFFEKIAQNVDVIVAPDKGAYELAHSLGERSKKPIASIKKMRPEKEKVKILSLSGEVTDKKVLIVDDMISTGNTIIQTSKKLKESGASEIMVAATHGIFADQASDRIEASEIEKVFVTNSLAQHHDCKKVEIVDISNWIKKEIIR